MKLNIGTYVLVELSDEFEHEFQGRIVDTGRTDNGVETYLVQDQDGDCFVVEEHEVSLLDDEPENPYNSEGAEQCPYCGSGLFNSKGECQKCGL